LDGSNPGKVNFDNHSYDEERRIFVGTLNFGSNTFFGQFKTVYTMIFSEDFCVIKDGEYVAYNEDGSELRRGNLGGRGGLCYSI
jgi:hypothetical protein